MPILLGAIADDFTGATDLANTLVQRGMRTVQLIGVPSGPIDTGDAEAVVVALKSRTAPAAQAVASSLAALAWLRDQGARQVVHKYCSTFDSTPDGNIGPVADALMDALEADFALVCPAFPANGRTIYQGHLFVGARLLSDSSMKDHPLTPMRNSDLVALMAAQSTRRVGLIPHASVAQGAEAVTAAVKALRADGVSYGVADALTDNDLETIGAVAAGHRLVTGGSCIALGLPGNFRRQDLLGLPVAPAAPTATGRRVVLAGSCSAATLAQIAYAKAHWPHHKLEIRRIAAGETVAGDVAEWACSQPDDRPALIYSSADPDEMATIQAEFGRERSATMIEETLGAIAQALTQRGIGALIVAGGETSGAVVSALGVQALRIGAEIDPGVPWTDSIGEPRLALALKSGNFGAEDFFAKAFAMLPRAVSAPR